MKHIISITTAMVVGGPDLQKTQVRKNRREGSSLERRKPDNTDLMEKDVCNTTIQACEKELEECDDGLLNSSMTSISRYGSRNVFLCPSLCRV